MVRKVVVSSLLALVALTTVGCDASTSSHEGSDSNFGGPGMTYNGKMGYDTGTGFVQPYDGSSPSLGFGF